MKYIGIGLLVIVLCLVAGFIDAALDKRKRDKEQREREEKWQKKSG